MRRGNPPELIRMQDKTITRYDVEALVDNELTWADAQNVMLHIKQDRVLSDYYEQLRTQKELLQEWWADVKTD